MKIYKTITCMLLLATGSIQAATVAFAPNPSTVGLGDTFSLAIAGTEFAGTEGGGAAFTFDQTILQVNSVTVDSIVWDVFTSSGTIDNVTGSVDGITVAAFVDPGANFAVATIEFTAIGLGVTTLNLAENPLNPWASGGSQINPTLLNGSVTVTAVPLPLTLWLFGSALGIFGCLHLQISRKFSDQ